MGEEHKFGNKAEEVKGGAKEKVGQATDDQGLENEGNPDQSKSKLKQAGGKVKDALKKD